MRQLRIAFTFATHLLALAFALYSTQTSGVKVQILLYAFIVDYVLRLWTIQMLLAESRAETPGWLTAIAGYISRPPHADDASQPIREGEQGPSAPLSVYFIVMAMSSLIAFVLANVGADQLLHLEGDVIDDLSWGITIGAVYWINSLVTRVIVIDPRLSFRYNLGYNTREVTVLFMAVLTGALIVAIRQQMDLGPSAWPVMGPLLFYKFLWDLWVSLYAVYNTHP